MKLYPYIQYFFYLGINWNWRIALHIMVHEIKGEKKYGIHTTGSDELRKTKAAGVDTSHATVYMPASYLLLEEIFNNLPAGHRHHFLDIGSGKGRALCVALFNGYKKVTGVDFSTDLCRQALANLQHTVEAFPSSQYKIVNQDAATFEIPADVTCIFFFNPFDHFVMKTVAKNIADSFNKNPRMIHVVYLNPLYKQDLLQAGFEEIYHTIRMKYMEAVILRKGPTPTPPAPKGEAW